METTKERLDNLITELGLSESRERAKGQIMAGNVYVNGQKVDKPGTKVDINSKIEIKGKDIPYVSRGGLKLEKALDTFSIDINGVTAMDIGASTGGFTDCMLQNGASKVYSVDVGYGQLAWKLRSDNRVVCLERTNIRYVTRDTIGELVDFITIDVSFISLTKVLPAAWELIDIPGRIVCLIKPQFEAGREKVGKKGVVRDKHVHVEVIKNIIMFCLNDLKAEILGLTFSPIKGPEGNIEYLLYIQKNLESLEAYDDRNLDILIERIVEEANCSL